MHAAIGFLCLARCVFDDVFKHVTYTAGANSLCTVGNVLSAHKKVIPKAYAQLAGIAYSPNVSDAEVINDIDDSVRPLRRLI